MTEYVPHAARISRGLMQAHAQHVLTGLIGQARDEQTIADLHTSNVRIWTDGHTAAARARLVELGLI